jgi:hypothetical protein
MYKCYLLLDRRYRSDESPDHTQTVWNLIDYNTPSSGTCCVNRLPARIIDARICTFAFNIQDKYITDQQLITVCINEFPQIFAGKKSQFIGRIRPATYSKYLVEFSGHNQGAGYYENNNRRIGHSGKCSFNNPIKFLHTISVSFNTTDSPIALQPDKLPFVYNVLSTGIIDFSAAHGVPSSYTASFRVYITNFTTNNIVVDSQLINMMSGELCATYLTDTSLTLSVPIINTSFPLILGVQQPGAQCYLDYHRFFIPMELTYMG